MVGSRCGNLRYASWILQVNWAENFSARNRGEVAKTSNMTDNLSLQRLIFTGNSTQEMRLRREISIILDLLVTESTN